jgi:hypothetical protein
LHTQPTPTQRYSLAATTLLRTVNIDLDTINQWAILDSGATSNFLTTGAHITKIQHAQKPIVPRLLNGNQVRSTHTSTLDLPDLPATARLAHIIPGLASHSLISVVTLCNAGCDVLFTKIGCTITHRGRTIMCGSKCMRTGLWMIPLQPSSQPKNCVNLHGGRPCAFHPPIAVLTPDPFSPAGPCTKLRTHNHPRPHFPPYHTPPPTINSN